MHGETAPGGDWFIYSFMMFYVGSVRICIIHVFLNIGWKSLYLWGVEAGKVLWLGESAHLWQIALQYIQKYPEKVLNQSCS